MLQTTDAPALSHADLLMESSGLCDRCDVVSETALLTHLAGETLAESIISCCFLLMGKRWMGKMVA